MQLLSVQFLLFFLLIFPISIWVKRNRGYLFVWLSVISLIFYAFAGRAFFIVLLVNLVTNYGLNWLIFTYPQYKRKILVLSIVINILFLAAYKYDTFLVDNLLNLNQAFNWNITPPTFELIAPLGISFFTFKNIAHLAEIYKGSLTKISFWGYVSYVSFFPEILSGPITKPQDYYEQAQNEANNDYTLGEIGTLFISALIKKFLIASYLFLYVVEPFDIPGNFSRVDLVIAMFAYTAMIYCDFSGYSDLAILLSRLLGLRSTSNFNYPYAARDFVDFWGRWHISLSEWFKTYVYIPLGGNRKGKLRKYLNIFATMLLSGLWHGAGWNYIVWGLYHGLGSVGSHIISDRKRQNPTSIPNAQSSIFGLSTSQLKTIVAWLLTLILISFSWVLFNADSLSTAGDFFAGMFTSKVASSSLLNPVIILLLSLILFENLSQGLLARRLQLLLNQLPRFWALVLLIIIIHIIINLGPDTVPPFIYFNF